MLNNPLKYTDPSGWETESEKAQREAEQRIRDEYGKAFAEQYGKQFGADGLTNQQWMNLGGEGVNSSQYHSYVSQNRDDHNRVLNGILNGSISITQTDYYWNTAYKDGNGNFVESSSTLVRTVIDVKIDPPSGGSVGQPGNWESMIPIWGSGRAAIDHFENGNYWRGVGYTALAISDVFLVKSLATAAGRGAWKLGAHSWSATRSWLGKSG